MENKPVKIDDAYVGEEVIIPNIFISCDLFRDRKDYDNNKSLLIGCPFMGFPWDGSSFSLHNLLIERCINNKIFEFKFGTDKIDIIRSKHVSHPLANNGDSLFVFDKQKNFLGSHKKIAEIICYLF